MAALTGKNIPDAGQTERNQKAEGGLRAVSGRTERVQAENRDALRGTDLLGALVTGFDGLADNNVKDVHERIRSEERCRRVQRPPLARAAVDGGTMPLIRIYTAMLP